MSILKVKSEAEHARAGWSQEFKKMAEADDDHLLDPTIFELEADEEEWEW